MIKEQLEKEKLKLAQTLEILKDVILDEETELQKTLINYMGSKEEKCRMLNRMQLHVNNLQMAMDKPYFARIDFTSLDDKKLNTIYIGKNGIMQNNDIVVTDWRAPISSLYYDAEVGSCSFNAPSGIVAGDMSLKRQFEIEKGILQEYFDVNLVSNDNLLQKYLNSNNDARLKSIVATIQKEQNEVIRKPIFDNLIVQGVAGSGKTTVALHRIAYLVYNYINNIKQNQYLVIGPNNVFLKYIKSVLPELDVSFVEQCTYEQFAKNYINEDIYINCADQKIINSISFKKNNNIDKFKCSTKYKVMIDKFIELYFLSITAKPLLIGSFEILSKEKITKIFQSTKSGYSNSLNARIENTIERLCNYIEEEKDNIVSRYNNYSYELFQTAKTDEEKIIMRNKFHKERTELNKNFRSTIRKYFNKSKISTTRLYKLFISTINDFNIFNFEQIEQLKKETSKNLKNNCFDFEDLAALIYLKTHIAPDKNYNKIKHVVIDEAQDLGEFNFLALKKALPAATFSIFGDLAQSIYNYRGINNWHEVNEVMFNCAGQIINFNKSYRTTAEIMAVADDVAESIGLNRSDLVVRHGDEVDFTFVDNDQDIPKYIAKKIVEFKEKGYKTIAIISKSDIISNNLNNSLAQLGINIPNVNAQDDLTSERFRICTISNQLAKGLEFDCVIINNANEKIYSSNSSLDMKLLYVAVTRALHELNIIYSEKITKPLENRLQKRL